MSVEENKAIARRLIEEGWANPDILKELFAEDVVWLGLRSNDIHDSESLERAAAMEKSGFPDWHFIVDDLVAEGAGQALAHTPASGVAFRPPPSKSSGKERTASALLMARSSKSGIWQTFSICWVNSKSFLRGKH